MQCFPLYTNKAPGGGGVSIGRLKWIKLFYVKKDLISTALLDPHSVCLLKPVILTGVITVSKGIVQRDLAGVKSCKVSFQRPLFNNELLIFYFLNLQGTCSLSCKKIFQRFKPKIYGLSVYMGLPLQRTDSGKPFHSHG
jgi:hypothetical protein